MGHAILPLLWVGLLVGRATGWGHWWATLSCPYSGWGHWWAALLAVGRNDQQAGRLTGFGGAGHGGWAGAEAAEPDRGGAAVEAACRVITMG